MGWFRRLRATLRGSSLDDDFDQEARFHLEQRTQEYIERGLPPDEARREASRCLGNLTLMRDQARDVDTLPWLADLSHDVRYAIRTFRKSPGFALVALLTLALGIGATTAVFSVVYGVLLRPLPFPQSTRLVRLWEEHPGGTAAAGGRWLSNRAYYAWVDHPRTVDALGGFSTYEYSVAFDDEPARLFGSEISPAILTILGAKPVIGRLFVSSEAEQGSSGAVLLGESLWHERFRASPSAIGRSLRINGRPYTIVGVIANGFAFPDHRSQFWLPYLIARVSTDPALSQRTSGFSAIGRIAPGGTPAQVEAEGTAAARSVPITLSTELLFGKGAPPVVHVRRFVDDISVKVRPALLVIATAVVLVLLIGCANVANLFLSRGVIRQRELVIRVAIGAGRGRLIRQLLTESLVLSGLGGALGVALAFVLVRIAQALAPMDFPRLDDVAIDARALMFACIVSVLAGIVSGLLPALRGAHVQLVEQLRGGDGASAAGFRGVRARRVRDGLLVAEAAFAVLLLVGATLLARSFVRLTHVDGGYESGGVLTARVQIVGEELPRRSADLIDGLLTRLRGTPGIASAGASSMMPLNPMTAVTSMSLPPGAGNGRPTQTRAVTYVVTPGYAETLRLRLREGRLFTDRDTVGSVRSIMVNDEFVRQYLSAGPVVGRRFGDLYLNDKGTTSEIIGVVGNVLKDGNDRKPEPEVYFIHRRDTDPSSRRIQGSINFAVRVEGDQTMAASTLRTIVREVDRTATVDHIEPLTDTLAASVAQPRFAATVLVTVAVLALALASIGLYGVLSYSVSQRRRELGVRAVLGADRGDLIRLVLREGLVVTSAGLIVGLLAAVALTRLMEDLLFGVAPLDAVSFATAPLVLLAVAIAACLLPAGRAAATDPAVALRSD